MPPPLPTRVPPPLPSRRPTSVPPLPHQPPPLPGERPGEFDPFADVQSGRDVPALPGGAILGRWVAVNSTNVNRIMAEQDVDGYGRRLPTCTIYIEFLSLALYKYPNRPLGDFLDLYTSSSKGRFCYYEVRGPGTDGPGMGKWPCVRLRGPQRSAVRVRQLARNRQPKTHAQALRYYTVGGKARAGGGTPSIR